MSLGTAFWLLLLSTVLNRDVTCKEAVQRNYDPHFFNVGPDSEKLISKPLENSVLKSRVEVLGEVLRHRILALRGPRGDNQLDLVFLVDASGSVGPENFLSELRFVRKLLADLEVSSSATRVALVTFSSPGSVFRHVDTISQSGNFSPTQMTKLSKSRNATLDQVTKLNQSVGKVVLRHKCAILERALPAIEYSGGGTYTLGALLEAQNILRAARKGARRAVFLLTDGYSNGGDPREAARLLREDLGAEVFTFGVRSGNTQELLEMASAPAQEHSFLLVSFEQFAALARRALHQDLRSAAWFESQESSGCNVLCDKKRDCCDEGAQCVCNTLTGRSQCLCPVGKYGEGLRGECHACPAGTYASTQALKQHENATSLFSTRCVPCPDPNHESAEGATSLSQCLCRVGFQTQHASCQVLECPALNPPDRGKFVRGACPRVFNAACGVSCHSGHRLVGSSIRLCLANGSWSGQPPQCDQRECPTLRAPRHGWVRCEAGNAVDARCELGCDHGYVLLGSKYRTCLALGAWDGLPSTCKAVTCSPIPVPRNAAVYPDSCRNVKQRKGQKCEIICKLDGYVLRGASKRECQASGKWSGAKPRCVDIQPPVIKCPSDRKVQTDLDEDFATLNISWPQVTDNSGNSCRIRVSPPVLLGGGHLSIGTTRVTLRATDLAGNFATCSFDITVVDRQAPTVDGCESPPPFLTDKDIAANVTWSEPTFSDNSGDPVKIWSSHQPGTNFAIDNTQVEYIATDTSGNNATCFIQIQVQPLQCENPLHGHAECSGANLHCSLTCDDGYAFALSSDIMCDPLWDSPFADCTVVVLPDTIFQNVNVDAVPPLVQDCNEKDNEISAHLGFAINEACGDVLHCAVEMLDDPCTPQIHDSRENSEEISNVVRQKRRINSKKHPEYKLLAPNNKTSTIKFRIVGQLKVASGSTNLRASLGTVRAILSAGIHNSSQRLPAIRIRFDSDSESLGCPTGSVLRSGDMCVQCPRGTFLSKGARECSVCGIGSFQSRPGQQSCVTCPPFTSTRASQLPVKRHHCVAMCTPGSRSRDGVVPCSMCPIGTFQISRGQSLCKPCPVGTTTHRRGADSQHLCRMPCAAGSVSRTGLAPCSKCPRNYSQPRPGQRTCLPVCSGIKCPGPLSASHPCMQSPCHGQATCLPTKNAFSCVCPPGFTGTFCEYTMNPCESEPCANAATCTHDDVNFTCSCAQGFSGPFCEEEEDECLSNLCANLGVCTDLPGDFSCDCAPGFAGVTCEEIVSACTALAPCLGGGLCEDLVSCNTTECFTCRCPPTKSGPRCEDQMDPCTVTQCLNGATCLPEPWPSIDNGQLPTVTCVCPEFYSGSRCEVVGGACASSPCWNGATCVPLKTQPGYRCVCPDLYAGPTCNITLQEDAVLRFPNSGTVDYVLKENALTRSLDKLTLCSWLRTTDTLNYGTPFSYATSIQDNTLALTDYSGFVVYVNGQRAVTDVSVNDGAWHLVCLLWASNQGAWSLFKDGRLSDSGTGLANHTLIPGGGTLVLGQEQDSPGGSFNAAQSFLGRLGPTALWPYLVAAPQLAAMFEECGDGAGSLLLGRPRGEGDSESGARNSSLEEGALWTWRDTLSGIRGKLQLEPSALCAGCSPPLTPQHGLVNVSGSGAGAIATFTCFPGYRQAGARRSVCSKRGAWQPDSVQPPSCTRIMCRRPEVPDNGKVETSSLELGSVARYSCLPGFSLAQDPSTRECLHTGEWGGEQPSCLETNCTMGSIDQGSWHRLGSYEDITAEVIVGDQVEVQCDTDFEIRGVAMLTCLDSGLWDNDIPECVAPCTGSPPSIPHSRPVLVSGSKARYSCLPGFSMQGSPLVSCNEIWGSRPRCIAHIVHCLSAPRIPHSDVSDNETHAVYTCDEGYTMLGNATLVCESGVWRPDPPQCLSTCDTPPQLEHGTAELIHTVWSYSCQPGYTLIGSKQITCEGGSWTSEDPASCKLTGCPSPRTIDNVLSITIRNNNHNKGGIVEYKCNKGFQLVGPRFRKCLGPDEQWSSVEPLCKPVP